MRKNVQGFTVNGQIGNKTDVEESYSDKCVYVEGNENKTTIVQYEGENVETILIGFHMEDMHILNCGYVAVCFGIYS